MSDLAAALQIAIKVHADQRDKQGEPYLLHVLRVVEAVNGERAKVLAALHDVVEAGYEGDLEDAFGENGMWIANSVEVLTRTPFQTYAEYIEDIRAGHSSTWVALIREVKLADLRDNLGRIPPKPPMKRLEPNTWPRDWGPLKRRYEKAIATLELTDAQRRALEAAEKGSAWRWNDTGFCDAAGADVDPATVATALDEGLLEPDPVGARQLTHTLVVSSSGHAALQEARG